MKVGTPSIWRCRRGVSTDAINRRRISSNTASPGTCATTCSQRSSTMRSSSAAVSSAADRDRTKASSTSTNCTTLLTPSRTVPVPSGLTTRPVGCMPSAMDATSAYLSPPVMPPTAVRAQRTAACHSSRLVCGIRLMRSSAALTDGSSAFLAWSESCVLLIPSSCAISAAVTRGEE